jgi:hypothetical protein
MARWFDLQPPDDEFQDRHDTDELLCMAPAVVKRRGPQPIHKLVRTLADERIAGVRKEMASVDFASRRTILRDGWSRLLGNITPTGNPIVKAVEHEETNGVAMERIVLDDVAQRLCLKVVAEGHAPFAPHLLYPGFMDDAVPEHREAGIACGLAYLESCDEVWAYVGSGISSGMRREIDHAVLLGKPVIRLAEV